MTIIAGVFTIVASALAIWAFFVMGPGENERETETAAPPPTPVVSLADVGANASAAGGSCPPASDEGKQHAESSDIKASRMMLRQQEQIIEWLGQIGKQCHTTD